MEEEASVVWGCTSLLRLALEVTGVRQEGVRALTWERLQEATLVSPVCVELSKLINAKMPYNVEGWPELLRPYFPHRHHLTLSDEVIMCGE